MHKTIADIVFESEQQFQTRQLVKKFENNRAGGRDFVVGDLHGCFNLFQQLLSEVNFDYSKDRIFSVGDLVDRGPDSYDCLMLRTMPWFHNVYGNHEELFVDGMLSDGSNVYTWMQNGGAWGLHLRERHVGDVDELVRDVQQDPVIIVIEYPDGRRINIVHAELNEARGWTDERIDMLHNGTLRLTDNQIMSVIWGRTLHELTSVGRMPEWARKLKSELSPTICGHTIGKYPLWSNTFKHLWIDTGAFLGYIGNITENQLENPTAGLTLIDITNYDDLKFHTLNTYTKRYHKWNFDKKKTWQLYQ